MTDIMRKTDFFESRSLIFLLIGLTVVMASSLAPVAYADDPGAIPIDGMLEDMQDTKVAVLEWPGALLGSMEGMLEYLGVQYGVVSSQDIRNGALENYDILICPGGSGSPLNGLGSMGADKVQDFVRRGGGYLGICAGALYASDYFVWQAVPSMEPPFDEDIVMGMNLSFDLFQGVGYFPIDDISVTTAMTQINFDPHPVTENLPDHMHILYAQGPHLQPYDGTNVTIVGTYDATGEPAMVALEFGRGKVFLSGVHPEYELDSIRDSAPSDPTLADEGSDWLLVVGALKWLVPEDGIESPDPSTPSGNYGLIVAVVIIMLVAGRAHLA